MKFTYLFQFEEYQVCLKRSKAEENIFLSIFARQVTYKTPLVLCNLAVKSASFSLLSTRNLTDLWTWDYIDLLNPGEEGFFFISFMTPCQYLPIVVNI